MPDEIWIHPHSAHQVIVQADDPIYQQGTGLEIGKQKKIVCSFGDPGPEGVIRDPESGEAFVDPNTGQAFTAVDAIRGGSFNLTETAARQQWTAEQVERARYLLDNDHMCRRAAKPVPVAPWPKYDSAHHNAIPELAEQLGLVVEALVYEEQTKARPSVIEKLRALIPVEPAEDQEGALTAA